MKTENVIVFIANKGLLAAKEGLFLGTEPKTINNVQLYINEAEGVFGAECLDRQAYPVQEDQYYTKKFEHLQNIFEAIESFLGDKKIDLEDIKHIHVFSHGFDIEETVAKLSPIPLKDFKLKNYADQNKWPWAALNGDMKPYQLWLTAFSHGNSASVQEILSKKTTTQADIIQLSDFLHNAWSIEKDHCAEKAFQEKLPEKLNQFSLNIQVVAENSLMGILPDGLDYLKQLKKELSKYANQKDKPLKPLLNIVFLPFYSITEAQDLSFYKLIIKRYHSSANPSAPILFIGFWDIMGMEPSEIEKKLKSKPDPRFRFLDSSIWYRYVALEKDFTQNLSNILDTIQWAYDNELYASNVCREILDFNNRMLLESYIKSEYGSGHSLNVYPFTFHSETKMSAKLVDKIKSLSDKGLRWNFLLIDDFANHQLRIGKADPVEGSDKTKAKILEELIIKGPYGKESYAIIEGTGNGAIEIATTPAEAKVLLKLFDKPEDKPKEENAIIYDIVLLDYLFSFPEDKEKVFGTVLLDYIKDSKIREGKSIRQSYWIFPITVFNEAIHSNLQEKGYQYFDSHWYMVRGADPLNTPNLFLSTLFDFMKEQVQKIIFEEDSLWQFFADAFQQEIRHEEVKSKVIEVYGRFVDLFSSDEGVPAGSALGKTANAYLSNSEVKDLRNHMRALLFFLGYSSGFDFPVIEREFFWIEDAYNKFKKNPTGNAGTIVPDHIEAALENLSKIIYNISGKYF
jgi:hypothetical protein